MLDKVEKWGDSVEAAVELALKDLKISRDEAEVVVLEQPSRGFLGFHKKLAKVQVTRKPEPAAEEKPSSEPEKKAEEPAYESPAPEEKDRKEETVSEALDQVEEKTEPADDAEAEPEEKAEVRKTAEPGSFFTGNTYSAPAPGNNANDETSGEHAHERRQKEDRRSRKGSTLMNTKFTVTDEDRDAVPADDSYAAEFIREIVHRMDLETVEVHGARIDDVLYISLTGEEVGALIGKRGKTLNSLQYLASIVENKSSDKYIRVLVNAEHYREKREKTLQQLARKIADKCAKSGRSQRLEPMNPYERKVIHSTLQGDPRVTTRSEGTEPSRRVVIERRK